MPRTDKSVEILTGMIVAALYVILLVGFSQESYMRRDAAVRVDSMNGRTVVYDVSKRICRTECPNGAAYVAAPAEPQRCTVPTEIKQRLVSEPPAPWTLENVKQAMREQDE